MARGTRIEIPQLSKFQRQLNDFGRDVEEALPEKYESPIRKTVTYAQGKAPRLSGKLANSIQQDVDKDGPFIYVDAPHAAITERGGTHPVYGQPVYVDQPARPFLGPAVDRYKRDLFEANVRAVKEASKKAGFR